MNILIKVVLVGMLGSQIACSDRRNTAPIFYGPDKVNITEGQALNMQLSAFDPEGQTLSFSISGGDDSYHFELTPSGVLNFVDPPDYDNPTDADGDNRYELSVTAFDGVNQSMQAIVITVDDNLVSTNDIEAQGATAGSLDNSASTDDSTSTNDSGSTDDTESMDASNGVDDSADTVDSDSADADTADDLVNTVAVKIVEKTGSENPFQESDTLSVDISSIVAIGITAANIEYRWYFASDDGTDSPFQVVKEYELTQADVGKRLKVKVSYEDDKGNTIIVESPETDIIRNVNENVDLANLGEGVGFKINYNLGGRSRAGWSTSIAGDVDGDNLADLVIGAPAGSDPDTTTKGAIYVVYGSSNQSDVTLNVDGVIDNSNKSRGFVIQGATQGDRSGESVSNAGDVNADGYADLVVGSPYADPNGKSNAGASYVIYGSSGGSNVDLSTVHASGSNNTKGFVIQGAGTLDSNGLWVANAGDVNADGYADLVVGSLYADPDGKSNAGESYVVYGSPNGSDIDLSDLNNDINKGFVVQGASANQRLGDFVGSAGDINNDGFDDVFITGRGSPYSSYMVSGKKTRSVVDVGAINNIYGDFTISGYDHDSGGGNGVATRSAGDINGDGYIDMIISNPNANGGKGIAYVVFGHWDPTVKADLQLPLNDPLSGFIIEGINAGDKSGWRSGSVGDINGDGYDDIIISAPFASTDEKSEAGISSIIYGRPSDEFADFTINQMTINDGFVIEGAEDYHQSGGRAFIGTGDVNGDDFDDVIIGAYDLTGPSSSYRLDDEDTYVCSVCASYVIYGGPTDYGELDKQLDWTQDDKSLVGSHGEDKLTWEGEGAVLIGGAGDDELIIGNENFVRIDGGNGVDTLTLASAINLNFTAENNNWHKNAITGIEVIDMTQDTSTKTLTLSAIDVLNLSNTSYTLKVHTGTNDTLELVNIADVTSWEKDDNSAIYTSTNNKATVEVTGTGTVDII
jgi:hypothetical protein